MTTLDPRESAIFFEDFYLQLRGTAGLAHRRVRATGSMSVVLEDVQGVLRLSRDGGTQTFLDEAGRRQLPGVARVIENLGALAPTQQQMQLGLDDFIWGAVIEELVPIEESESDFKLVLAFSDLLLEHMDDTLVDAKEAGRLQDFAGDFLEKVPAMAPITLTLVNMLDVVATYRMDLDLSATNFMRRPATGEIVLSDPVGSSAVYPTGEALAHLLRHFEFTVV